jgi:glycosyltransferase involved in cell wall biosynthesis
MRRFHGALKEKNHQSQFLVGRSKFPEDPLVHLIWDEVLPYRSLENSLKSRIGNQIEKYLGIHPWANRTTLGVVNTSLYQWADIIDLRNLFGGFFNLWSLPSLTAGKPVVWRLPDLWALTGHCAYPYDCQRWKTGCYACPLLTREGRKMVEPKPTVWDGSRRVWKAKKELYRKSKLHIIVTTNWMRDNVKQSILGDALSINVISNGVNLKKYQPISRKEARSRLELPQDERMLLWAAGGKGNYRKGYHLAVEALEQLNSKGDLSPMLLTMGGEEGWKSPVTLPRIQHFGYVRDAEKQALIYAAADGFICSTLADGQPQTALESLACGTPIIAFDIGPMPDLAITGETGYLAPETTATALREVIETFLLEFDQYPSIRENCRAQAVEKYDLNKQTEKYVHLYEEVLSGFQNAV